ncbi:hypothetical protein [Marivirga arenosa]|uniref:Carboxypeptidase-like protein n=1 Tax=Marivirga arenosa TaxID=3059076 RepID=A0AA49GF70_9BACT|nr:hypothetical protein [Marivirga sp. BKB1-2]WKK82116.1 hypothetical protein QYS47_08275 [Marivirga sp. BKB1-2]
MKLFLFIFLISLSTYSSFGQKIEGIIQSSKDGLSIEGAHILNISSRKLAISSELGNFYLEANVGDTLIISSINYKKKQFIIYTKKRVSILLDPNVIQLDEVVVSNLPKTEADFRKKLINMPMQDNGKFVPYGVTPGKPIPKIPVIYNSKEINTAGYAIRNPLRFAASKINPKFREKVKYWDIQADLDDSYIRNKKFNRELVASLTDLKGDDLTDFINYMKLSIEFLNTSSAYEVAEKIKEKYKEYIKTSK